MEAEHKDGLDWPTIDQIEPMRPRPKPTTELEAARMSATLSFWTSPPERPYQYMTLDHLSVFAADVEKGLAEAYADDDLMEISHLGAVLDQVCEEIAKRVF